jgi:hypothetical protein
MAPLPSSGKGRTRQSCDGHHSARSCPSRENGREQMIRVVRPGPAPAALDAGVALVAALDKTLAADPANGGHPPSTFRFDNKIYGHRSVKDTLWAAQHDKCAYCEGSFRAFSYGDVEHYRPKAYAQQSTGGKKIYPGYYWLAYHWENLLVSCELCNRARKKNLFPLRNPTGRARDDVGIAQEHPLLIDPAGPDDPRCHIGFRGAAPEARTDAGKTSIEAYYLDRYLTAARARHLREIASLKEIVDVAARIRDVELDQLALKAKAELDEVISPTAEFSAMTRDYLGK